MWRRSKEEQEQEWGKEEQEQEQSLKKINGDQYEKTLRNGTCEYYLTWISERFC